MPQVIYAWNYVEWGGAQIHLLAIIREASNKYDVTVVLPRGSNPQLIKFIEETGVLISYFEDPVLIGDAIGIRSKLRRHWLKVKSEYGMLKALERNNLENCAFVHIDLAPWQSLFALIWLSMRLPVFVTIHNSLGDVSALRRMMWTVKLRIISHFKNFHAFTSNKNAREYFRGMFSESKFEDVTVTYTSVDPAEIDEALALKDPKASVLKRYNIPDSPFLVFCVGQFIDRKGRWTFMGAAKRVLEDVPEAMFVWISNSVPTESEMQQAEGYGLGHNFKLLTSDQLGDEHVELFELLKTADLFVLASEREGLPISLLEAMALGIPCISTNINAIPEAIVHGETGLLVEPGNKDALAVEILRIFNSGELRQRLSKNGRELVINRFSDKVVAGIALGAYQDAINDAE